MTFYREIEVILDAKTYLTQAIQLIHSAGNSRTVYQLMEQKAEPAPSDRDELIKPDLSGFKVTDDKLE